MASVWSSFATPADPRSGNAQRHKLLDIVTIALVGSICGAESCADFVDFARDREPLFREFLELPGGLPSHDTFSRVFRLLNPTAFARCFVSFLEDPGAERTSVVPSTARGAALVRSRGGAVRLARGHGLRRWRADDDRPGGGRRQRKRNNSGSHAARFI